MWAKVVSARLQPGRALDGHADAQVDGDVVNRGRRRDSTDAGELHGHPVGHAEAVRLEQGGQRHDRLVHHHRAGPRRSQPAAIGKRRARLLQEDPRSVAPSSRMNVARPTTRTRSWRRRRSRCRRRRRRAPRAPVGRRRSGRHPPSPGAAGSPGRDASWHWPRPAWCRTLHRSVQRRRFRAVPAQPLPQRHARGRAARSHTATSRGALAYGVSGSSRPSSAGVTDWGLRGSAPRTADASIVSPAICPGGAGRRTSRPRCPTHRCRRCRRRPRPARRPRPCPSMRSPDMREALDVGQVDGPGRDSSDPHAPESGRSVCGEPALPNAVAEQLM